MIIDVIEILKNGHGGIQETILLRKKYIDSIGIESELGTDAVKILKKKMEFLNDVMIPHFRQEEVAIFLIRNEIDMKTTEGEIIRKVLEEHVDFRERIDAFIEDTLINTKESIQIPLFKNKFNKLLNDILEHAEFEDEELFPIIRNRINPGHIKYIKEKWNELNMI